MMETNRYNNGKIYKLVSPHSNNIYIGSTCKERLCQRLAKHKSNYKDWLKNNNGYITSFELFELGDVEIILIESINCNTKDELLKKEREYIEKYKDIIVNKNRPSRTSKQYREDNKEKLKQYSEDNKEVFKQKQKKYYEENKEKYKKYREDNKEVIEQKRKQIYDCECGSSIEKIEKARHLKSLKHQKYLNSLQT